MGKTFIAAAALAAATLATPASAAIIISTGGNTAQGQTVQFNTQQTGTTITGTTNQTNTPVTFTRVGGGGSLASDAAGQAVVINNGSDPSNLTGTVAVDLFGNTAASYIEFNLPGIPGTPPPAESTTVLIQALSTDGLTVLASNELELNGNGQNYFNITGTNGDTFGGFRITLAPVDTGVGALQNVRVITSVAAAVPEPGTWALMLLGFGGVGVSMRRRRSKVLMQVA
ncbi:PEPxxWA-CTERM sorting domain-containing protein [Sphingomonas kaistensis]|uniref:PEPxxWA-CTERM sorting domain-containing protein n=1 Tax=Sphingomonas kaistensis TaxID=298708 RepID=A0ABZ2FYL0_9SPHN